MDVIIRINLPLESPVLLKKNCVKIRYVVLKISQHTKRQTAESEFVLYHVLVLYIGIATLYIMHPTSVR